MRLLILLCATVSIASCGPRDIEFIETEIPDELLRPVPVPDGPVSTVNDLAERLVETRAGLDQANGQIGAIAEIAGGPR